MTAPSAPAFRPGLILEDLAGRLSGPVPWAYLIATALAGEPIPPGAFSGALTRNAS